MKSLRRFALMATVAGSAIALGGAAYGQSTSSSLRVTVVDQQGNPVDDTAVEVVHIPTGKVRTIQTNNNGMISARGLQVGGPYMVRLPDGAEYSAPDVAAIFLTLGQTEDITLPVSASGEIEEVTITASALSSMLRTGAGEDFSAQDIQQVPSISRDFVSVLQTDSKVLVDTTVARGPAVSIAGSNFRFNSVTIDGVPQNDNFGLSKNASATQRSPISIDAIEQINVNIAPFDVTYGNFLGGNINIVTKSGTNEFHGSAYAFYSDDSLTGNDSGNQDLRIGDFEEETYGGTLGGPIVKDKLFFFANYERFETTLPSNSASIERIQGVTQEDVDRVRQITQDQFGFDPGAFDAVDTDTDEKILIKLDWNVNEDHRATVAFQRADGDVLFDDFPEVASLQSNRYNINERMNSWSFQLFSDWTDNFSTEMKVGWKDVNNRQVSVQQDTPEFTITAPGGGTINAGGDRFRQANELDNNTRIIKLKGDYYAGAHTITGGYEQQRDNIRNLFQPFSQGQFLFGSIDDFEARNPFAVLFGNSFTGDPKDTEVNFALTQHSFYLQDEWVPIPELTITAGLRYDVLENNGKPTLNPNFVARNGFTNQENLDGKDLWLPRLGVNYQPTDRLTLRGGVGLFGGGSPLVWLANSYGNNGMTRRFASFFFLPAAPDVAAAAQQALSGEPDGDAAIENLQPFIANTPTNEVDAIDPDFDLLSNWKMNLAVDYTADLSSVGLGDGWDLSAEAIWTSVKDGVSMQELRREQVGTAPDGRPIYNFTEESGDFLLTNDPRGNTELYTFEADKSWDTDYGYFDLGLSYSYMDKKEVRSANRFVAFELFAFDATTDFNNMDLADSKFEVPHRITGTLTWEEELWGDNKTAIDLVYIGRSGRKFSYTFGSGPAPFGGTFLADFGSEGDNPGSQLFYVPTGINDPLVTSNTPNFLANLNEFIDNDKCLQDFRGSIVPRNACSTSWVNQVNLQFTQEFRIGDSNAFEFIFNIENLGNLIDKDWGRVESFLAPSNVAVANASISADGSQFVLDPAPGSEAGQPNSPGAVTPDPTISRIPSVYKIQLGLRYKF
ncbi:TonB-dependent receptor [Yunchengibacter salinarum]|uniref:TonB-dependent receptor n=1 Tax=Yunchengibacter salinarum TaxID=3133399 RepID=UPI0035B587F8